MSVCASGPGPGTAINNCGKFISLENMKGLAWRITVGGAFHALNCCHVRGLVCCRGGQERLGGGLVAFLWCFVLFVAGRNPCLKRLEEPVSSDQQPNSYTMCSRKRRPKGGRMGHRPQKRYRAPWSQNEWRRWPRSRWARSPTTGSSQDEQLKDVTPGGIRPKFVLFMDGV